ncbi:MAG TPA: hypothetical protein VFQ45_17855 [Longimicrobium sp.]|nr:hypothetical protein [Longimicrobium sp.]
MAFEKRPFRDLYESMAADLRRRTAELTDFEEGSVVRSLFESVSVEMALLYEQMDLVYQSGFVDTATGPNLDRVVAVLGITRNEPDFATGEVTFERDPGATQEITIPVGTLVTTEENPEKKPVKKAYLTREEGRLRAGDTAVDVKVQAEERGADLFTESETVVVMPRPVPGIKTVHNKRPIRFLGRGRETDEELRDRAKKALLASGRASATAIENALLALPYVRGVRVRESFPATTLGDPAPDAPPARGRGEVDVFVDGLRSDNYDRLRDRVNEVRAAGVYVRLMPAVAINTQVTLRITADPAVTRDQVPVLERNVRDRVIDFMDRLRMGNPLLFSQLTREVLNVKGVTDLADFRVVTFREGLQEATGAVTLTRARAVDANLPIPRGTLLTTTRPDAGGAEPLLFEVVGPVPAEGQAQKEEDVLLPAGQAQARVTVRATRTGRGGELLRTGSAALWEPVRLGDTVLAVVNDAPLRLPREVWTPEMKQVPARLEERFSADLVRAAAEPKPLDVQVQVALAIPTAAAQEAALKAAADAVVDAGKDAEAGLAAALKPLTDVLAAARSGGNALGLALDEQARTDVAKVLAAFGRALRRAAEPALRARMADPRPGAEGDALRDAVVTAVRAYFASLLPAPPAADGEDGGAAEKPAAVAARPVIEVEVLARVEAAIRATLGADAPETRIAADLGAALGPAVAEAGAAALADFPAAELERVLRDAVDRVIAARIQAETDAVTKASRELADATTALGKAAGDPAGDAYRQAQARADTARASFETIRRDAEDVQGAAGRAADAASRAVPAAVAALRAKVEEAIAAAARPAALAAKVLPALKGGAFETRVRLRALTFDGALLSDAPWLEPGFVEQATARTVFVYTRELELAGTIALSLPLTATDADKREIRKQVRQSVADYVDGLEPEENVDLARVEELSRGHDRVLGAAFTPAPALEPRIRGGAVDVAAWEKAVVRDSLLIQG